MKIVMIEEDILTLLTRLGVKAFTDVPKVFGVGETGRVFASFEQPGSNSMILAALEEDEAALLVDGLRDFHRRSARDQHGAKIPVRAFVVPCVQAL
jgi:hypothetical protein